LNPLLDPDARLVIGHRGSPAEAPENTLPAFEAALRRGADAIELDVRLTADGAPVVIHDATLDRTTNRTGPVAALTLAELRGVDAGWRFTPDRGRTHPYRGADTRIPTLGEVLWAFPKLSVLVEIKEPPAQEAVRRVLLQEDAVARCVVASEHREALLAFAEPPFVCGASAPDIAALYRAALFRQRPPVVGYRMLSVPLRHRGL
jgi:glycerophosphoryl diester phosphodiesterase